MSSETEEKIRQQFNRINFKLRKWPEDKVKNLLKMRLAKDGWKITEISMGKKQGVDLKAVKSEYTIIVEAKGEPKSPLSFNQQRREYIGGALMSLISQMTEENTNQLYCMAFPDNEYYLRGVKNRIPLLIREKLKIYALFLEEDGSIRVLLPSGNKAITLINFDQLLTRTNEY